MQTWTGIWISDLQISSLELYHLSYPDSINRTDLSLRLESNAIQVVWPVTLSVTIWEFQARDLEVQDSNPSPGSNFSLEFE